jgi:Ca2+-binding RTX toxin-like protein
MTTTNGGQIFGGPTYQGSVTSGNTVAYDAPNLIGGVTYYALIQSVTGNFTGITYSVGDPAAGVLFTAPTLVESSTQSSYQLLAYTAPVSGDYTVLISSAPGADLSYRLVTGDAYASVRDVSAGSGVALPQIMDYYTGPVSYLQNQFVEITPDNLNITTQHPNVFLHSGSGEDALQVMSGQNVLDGGTGSNFLVGGSGHDTFFTDARGGGITWDTIVNFHPGDGITLWGYVPGVSQVVSWSNNDGAQGFQGITVHFSTRGDGVVDASITLAGLHSVGNAAGDLPPWAATTTFPYVVTTGAVDGNSYMHLQA